MKPLVKWAGGKQKLLEQILPHVPKEFDTYYEPFLGGAALFFELQPEHAILSDTNAELINFYEVIKKNMPGLVAEISSYPNTPEFFYELRELDRTVRFKKLSALKRAARFLYLNKTCYNGLYRTNKQGEFNTPYGKYKNPKYYNLNHLKDAFLLFNHPNHVTFSCCGYEVPCKKARRDDFVYLDPPYYPIKKDSFVSYGEQRFHQGNHVMLANMCHRFNKNKVKFLLSNSHCPYTLDLYKDFEIVTVQARRNINTKSSGRGPIKEILVKNY